VDSGKIWHCPYCGVEIISEKAYWGHLAICPQGPQLRIQEPEIIKKEPPVKVDKKKR